LKILCKQTGSVKTVTYAINNSTTIFRCKIPLQLAQQSYDADFNRQIIVKDEIQE